MGRPIGCFFMVCAGLSLLFLISDLVWLRRTGVMFMPFGQELTAAVIGLYVGSFIGSMFSAWVAFVLEEIRMSQQEVIDRIAGRGTGDLTGRSEPKLQRDRAA
ncbi:hypothetical protein [Jannaschia rubra]|uniref:hypothetical protein n=1 Tax=Jannaschia rubra TaxID=282197 RepID=UPI00248F7F06|nr:hypothetical protein [Jannaschia rubra]